MKKFITVILLLANITLCQSQDFIKNNRYSGDSLYDFIHEWWGVRYLYGGSTKKGIDCSAFTLKLFKTVYNVDLPRTAREQYLFTDRIPKTELKDGDLVFFRTRYKSTWHVGLYLTDGWFVHSKSKVGVTFDNLNNGTYNKSFYGTGRIKKTY